jgi:hypothetical protein
MGVITGDAGSNDATMTATPSDGLYLTDVLLLCVECRQPIKARINTQQWIRVEWISPYGTCQVCWNKVKEQKAKE